jgi:hypothetical protein
MLDEQSRPLTRRGRRPRASSAEKGEVTEVLTRGDAQFYGDRPDAHSVAWCRATCAASTARITGYR